VFEYGEQGPVDLDWITLALRECFEKDDVFRPEFLQAVLFLYRSGAKLSFSKEATAFLHEQGAAIIATHQATGHERDIKSGPYYHSAGALRPVWRLYEDTHSAFLQTLIPNQSG